jgi:hypothetical protein
MKKRFVVKNFLLREYWTYNSEWGYSQYEAHEFETLQDAEDFISRQDGKFQIETIYII